MIAEPKDSIIVVSGLPRSGTSMLMKMLEAGGLPVLTDHIRNADEDNPKGYYEFERAKDLRSGDDAWVALARGKVVKVISALLRYLPVGFDYKVLFVQRALPEVLASQRQMLIRRGKNPDDANDADMIRIYQKHLAEINEWLAKEDRLSTLYVSYNELLEKPEMLLVQINTFLDGSLDLVKMKAVIDPNLYRQRS
jgi:hypothetical protein